MSAPRTIVAHLSDTHIVSEGASYFGCDTARFLSDAIDALHALPVPPDCVVVTGDLANSGRPAQYARFREVMSRLRVPYFVIPGNHDEPGALRAHLAPQTYGGSRDGLLRYVIDDFAVRIVGLDANDTRGWPGAGLRRATLAWLRDVVQAPPAPDDRVRPPAAVPHGHPLF